MRHRMAGRKLGRTTSHRWAMLRNMATSLFRHERITTTVSKAKELRPFAEKMITLAKKESLHARRQVLRHIKDREVVAKLFDTLGPRYATRPGGYSRIVRTALRRGDSAELAIIELIDTTAAPAAPKKKKAAAKKTRKGAQPTRKPTHKGTARQEALADVAAVEEARADVEAQEEAAAEGQAEEKVEAAEAEAPKESEPEEAKTEEEPQAEEPKAETSAAGEAEPEKAAAEGEATEDKPEEKDKAE